MATFQIQIDLITKQSNTFNKRQNVSSIITQGLSGKLALYAMNKKYCLIKT